MTTTTAPRTRNRDGQPWLKQLDSGIWQICHSPGDGSTTRVSTRTKDEAQARLHLEQFRASLVSAQERSLILTVSDIFRYYREQHVNELVNDTTRREYALGWLEASLGRHRINELTPEIMRNYVRARRTAKAPVYQGRTSEQAIRKAGDGTLRYELLTLITAFNFATDDKKIPPNSLPRIQLPDEPAANDIWLNEDEHDWLLNFVQGEDDRGRMTRIWRFVAIALGTAARKSAIIDLTWDRVDLKAGMIHFAQGIQRSGTQKSSKKTVPVPIPEWLLPLLERAHGEKGDNPYVLDEAIEPSGAFQTIQRRAFEATGNSKFRDMTPHVLRHTTATLMARAGVPIAAIAAILGNSIQVCSKKYIHHCPEHLRGAINYRRAEIEQLL
jgi:integrase